jgi:hypothetical protein
MKTNTRAALELAAAMGLRHDSMAAVEWVMRFFGIMTHGVEYVEFEPSGEEIRYVNRGDTYDDTVCFDGNSYMVCSWGAWLESEESRYTEQTGQTGCPNCGEWSERDEGCEHCGYEE